MSHSKPSNPRAFATQRRGVTIPISNVTARGARKVAKRFKHTHTTKGLRRKGGKK